MKRLAMAAALSTLCLTSCGEPIPIALTPDPAKLDDCPDVIVVAPRLEPYQVVALPDGRSAVLLDTMLTREGQTADYIIHGPLAGYRACRSVVRYVKDWSAGIGDGT